MKGQDGHTSGSVGSIEAVSPRWDLWPIAAVAGIKQSNQRALATVILKNTYKGVTLFIILHPETKHKWKTFVGGRKKKKNVMLHLLRVRSGEICIVQQPC